MWLIFIITFIVFLLVILALATGLLVSGKTIKGSCGGIGCGLCKNKTAVGCNRANRPRPLMQTRK